MVRDKRRLRVVNVLLLLLELENRIIPHSHKMTHIMTQNFIALLLGNGAFFEVISETRCNVEYAETMIL